VLSGAEAGPKAHLVQFQKRVAETVERIQDWRGVCVYL
jgi:hypothetical protein